MTRALPLLAALICVMLVPGCIGTSQNGNLVRANSRYHDQDYAGTIELAGELLREVDTEAGPKSAIDCLLRAHRPPA